MTLRWDILAVAIAAALAAVMAMLAIMSDAALLEAKAASEATIAPPPAPAPAASPNTDDGKPVMQLNPGAWNNGNPESPLINMARMFSLKWTAEGRGRTPMEFGELWRRGYIDKATLLPKAIPPGYEFIRSSYFNSNSKWEPDYFLGDYVLEWEGDADIELWLPDYRQRAAGANRIEAEMRPGNMRIEITRIGKDGLHDIALYMKRHEDAFRAGEIFNPDFVAYARRYKILRSLNIQAASIWQARSVDQLNTKSARLWNADPRFADDAPDAPLGVPVEALFDMTMATDTALWFHVPGMLGAPEVFETFEFSGKIKEALKAAATEHARAAIASQEWDRYADRIVAALIASGYPQSRALYGEISNELWNFAHPFWFMTTYYWGLGEALKGEQPGISISFAQGYAAGRFALAMKGALERAGRDQAFVSVIGGQMANPETSRSALRGFRQFFLDRGLDPAPWLANAGLATAHYYAGALDKRGVIPKGAMKDSQWAEAWLDAIREDPQGMAQKARDWLVERNRAVHGNLASIIAKRARHRAIAEEMGAFLLGSYEGESHETHGVASLLKDEPDFVEWFKEYQWGDAGGAVTKAWVEALIEDDPEAVISNFMGVGLVKNHHGLPPAWDDGFYGEENGRTRALEAFLRN